MWSFVRSLFVSNNYLYRFGSDPGGPRLIRPTPPQPASHSGASAAGPGRVWSGLV